MVRCEWMTRGLTLALACLAAPVFATVFYVDGARGLDSRPGTDPGLPKKTIQHAINAAQPGDEIRVAPGTYAPIEVRMRLVIIAPQGRDRTFIDGGGKKRCVWFGGVDGFELRGFTIQNGYAGKDHGGGVYQGILRDCLIRNCRTFDGGPDFGGGGIHLSHLFDCRIENCRAGFGGAMHGGEAWRCTFRENYAWDRGGALWEVVAHHSLLHDNRCDNRGGQPGGAGAHASHLYNCTVTRNRIGRDTPGAGGLHGCWSYNCIVWANENPWHPEYHQYRDPQARPNDHWQSDPHFRHPDRLDSPDFHLMHDSPCRRIGDRTHFPEWGQPDFAERHRFDRDRNPRFHGEKFDLGCFEEEESFNTMVANADGSVDVIYNPMGEKYVEVAVDAVPLLSASTNGVFRWQPQSLGWHTNVFTYGKTAITGFVHVVQLPYWVQAESKAPMPLDANVRISPTTKTVKQAGDGFSISTQGSTTNWTAVASADWIVLDESHGDAGEPVAYTATLNTNAETRVGYIYVSGHVYTISQSGVGVTFDNTSAEFESAGGSGTVTLKIADRHIWKARPNVDWISVSPTSGMSDGTVTYTVAPYYEVTTRSGTITIGGSTFTVFQYGRRMALDPEEISIDHHVHVYPITVDALDITAWDATPNNSWLSIVSITRNSKTELGAGIVTIAAGSNTSYVARSGTVTIGTETFSVQQAGTTDLSFKVTPETATASANGANGRLAVEATSDLPWSAESSNNWVTVYTANVVGTGNGNIAYTVSPNNTVYERTGIIVVTPDPASGLAPVVHRVTQEPAVAAISPSGYEFIADGESATVTITVAKNVTWTVDGIDAIDWLSINGEKTSFIGPQTITLAASANDTVYRREGSITIAGRSFSVAQKGCGIEVDDDFQTTFDAEGGMDVINVYPDGDVEWTATSSDKDWLTVSQDGVTRSGENGVKFWVSEYNGDGANRTGTITIGDKTVTIMQTAYSVTISPMGKTVTGNAGEGEIGVSAGAEDVWIAVATEPWITVVTKDGKGNGTVTFAITDNDTGKTRTGKILINDQEYELVQQARQLVAITGAVDGHGGAVAKAGAYDLGTKVQLTAVPDPGYRFSYWTLPDSTRSMVNPIEVTADVAKTYTATFVALTPEIQSCVSGEDGVTLAWTNLAWSVTNRIWRGSSDVPSEAVLIAEVENDGSATYLDESGDIGQAYFYWVESVGPNDATTSAEAKTGTHRKKVIVSKITYTNLKGATHTNPTNYTEESLVTFVPPTGGVAGYVFSHWEPAQITTDMVGPQTVTAVWTANSSSIGYDPNGGAGVMTATGATYDVPSVLPGCSFEWANHTFVGWATNATGEAVYQPGDAVRNLTDEQNGIVTLFAVWSLDEPTEIAAPVITPENGAIFLGSNCTVTISCATEGAAVYYSTTGKPPKPIPANLYNGPITIVDTTTVIAIATYGELDPQMTTATITKKVLTLGDAVGATNLVWTTGETALWSVIADETATAKDGLNISAQSGTPADEGASWLETTVSGAGTFSFHWKCSCESGWFGALYDHLEVQTNGVFALAIDGVTDWTSAALTLSAGMHTIRFVYSKDEEGGEGADCGWLDSVQWQPTVIPPSVPGDEDAVITGDAESGYTVKPSEGKTAVEVTIPAGVAPGMVTVEVGANVTSVRPNGATVKIMSGEHNITSYLDVPSADANGVVDLTKATVKESIVKEALDTTKGAVVELNAASPTLTTSETKPGLTYEFYEGTSLEAVGADLRAAHPGETKLGDGASWTPTVTIKGGTSGFYSIGVKK